VPRREILRRSSSRNSAHVLDLLILWGGEGGEHDSAPHRVQQKIVQLRASPHAEASMQTVEKNFHTGLKTFAQAILLITIASVTKRFV